MAYWKSVTPPFSLLPINQHWHKVSLSFIAIHDVSFNSGLVDSAAGLVRIIWRESSHHHPITVCVIFVFTEASNIYLCVQVFRIDAKVFMISISWSSFVYDKRFRRRKAYNHECLAHAPILDEPLPVQQLGHHHHHHHHHDGNGRLWKAIGFGTRIGVLCGHGMWLMSLIPSGQHGCR